LNPYAFFYDPADFAPDHGQPPQLGVPSSVTASASSSSSSTFSSCLSSQGASSSSSTSSSASKSATTDAPPPRLAIGRAVLGPAVRYTFVAKRPSLLDFARASFAAALKTNEAAALTPEQSARARAAARAWETKLAKTAHAQLLRVLSRQVHE
jgi:hypothetical protein